MKKFVATLIVAVTMFLCIISVSAVIYPDFSINDITNIQKWLVGLTTEIDREFADADKNGVINVKDVTYRQKELAKIPPYYTEPETEPQIPEFKDDNEDIFEEL